MNAIDTDIRTPIEQAQDMAERISEAIASEDFNKVWSQRGWAIDLLRRLEAAEEAESALIVQDALREVDSFRARRVAETLKFFLKDGEEALADESSSHLERVSDARAAASEVNVTLRAVEEDFFLRRALMSLWGSQGREVLERKKDALRLLEAGIASFIGSSEVLRKSAQRFNDDFRARMATGNFSAARKSVENIEAIVGSRSDLWKEIETCKAARSQEGKRRK